MTGPFQSIGERGGQRCIRERRQRIPANEDAIGNAPSDEATFGRSKEASSIDTGLSDFSTITKNGQTNPGPPNERRPLKAGLYILPRPRASELALFHRQE